MKTRHIDANDDIASPLISTNVDKHDTNEFDASLITHDEVDLTELNSSNTESIASSIFVAWGPAQKKEARLWAYSATPIGLSILLRNAVPLTDLIFLGHLGTTQLAGASLAQIFIIVTSSWCWKCIGGALNSLCSQAYGAGNPRLVGVWLQISLLCISCFSVLIAISWWFTGDVLRLLGFSDEQASLAASFARWYSLSLLPTNLFVCVSNWLQSGGAVMPVLLTNVLIVGINAVLNVALVFNSPLGFIGSPIASSITSATALLILLTLSISLGHTKRGWQGWDRDALDAKNIRVFLGMALPAGIGNFAEDAQLQVVAFLAAKLGEASVATHNAFVSFFLVVTCLLYGCVKATTIRIGHHLGARNVPAALFVLKLDLLVSSAIAVTVGALILSTRSYLGHIFSSDEEVWALADSIALPVGLGYCALAIFYVSMAALQAQGRVRWILAAFVAGAWGVTVPVAVVWTQVYPRGLVGIWDALVLGYGAITLIAGWAVLRSDWHAAAEAAFQRSKAKLQGAPADAVRSLAAAAGDECDDASAADYTL